MLDFLKKTIEATEKKMITYAEFMEIALYHPEYGYYMKNQEKIGKKGDFLTTSSYSNIFGQFIAKWFLKKVEELGLPAVFCEVGGGTGKFAQAFIEEWQRQTDRPLQYTIIEGSPYHRKVQQENLDFSGSLRQLESMDQLEPFTGVLFSNELFDALPVHIVENMDGQLMEAMVTWRNGGLSELLVPLDNEEIVAFLAHSKIKMVDGQRLEIPLAMKKMVAEMGRVLERGIVLTFDYGYSDEEWMEPIHRQGSIRGYFQHKMKSNILENPGNMDITTHIHFDALIRMGEEVGLEFLKKERQDEFLLANGILKELEDHYDPNPFSEVGKRNRAIRSLILPNSISSYFHVIQQGKKL